MKDKIIDILQGDLEEARINEICEMIKGELEWLRRRLHGHSKDDKSVLLDYVDARIDDMEVYLKK